MLRSIFPSTPLTSTKIHVSFFTSPSTSTQNQLLDNILQRQIHAGEEVRVPGCKCLTGTAAPNLGKEEQLARLVPSVVCPPAAQHGSPVAHSRSKLSGVRHGHRPTGAQGRKVGASPQSRLRSQQHWAVTAHAMGQRAASQMKLGSCYLLDELFVEEGRWKIQKAIMNKHFCVLSVFPLCHHAISVSSRF